MTTKDGYNRLEYLREAVEEGEDAKKVLKFMKQYLDDTSRQTLETIREETDKEKINDAISYYRAVVRFCEMLESTVSIGERKEKALAKELKN